MEKIMHMNCILMRDDVTSSLREAIRKLYHDRLHNEAEAIKMVLDGKAAGGLVSLDELQLYFNSNGVSKKITPSDILDAVVEKFSKGEEL
jgi:hypothetical protein